MQKDTKGRVLIISTIISVILTIMSSSYRIQIFSATDFDINLKTFRYIFLFLSFGLVLFYILRKRLKILVKSIFIIGAWIIIFILVNVSSYYLLASFPRCFYNNHKETFTELIKICDEQQICLIDYYKKSNDYQVRNCDSVIVDSPTIQDLSARLGFLEYRQGNPNAFLFDDNNYITGFYIYENTDSDEAEKRKRVEYGGKGQGIKIDKNVYLFTY
jgi:hypothetical protein